MRTRSNGKRAIVFLAVILAVCIAICIGAVVILRHLNASKNIDSQKTDPAGDVFSQETPAAYNAETDIRTAQADHTLPAAAESTAQLTAESIIDIYLEQNSLWTKDEYINLETAEHKYQFLDLDFDGIPELVVSVGNGMRGDSFNNYFHIDFSNKKVVKYGVLDEEDGANQSSLYYDVKLVQNSATGGKEYRTECHRASRFQSYILKKAITLKSGKVSDLSIYGEGTEYDDSGNERDMYYRFDSNFQEISLSKSEYDRIVSADQAACRDLHLKFTKLDGESFDALSKSEKKAQLLKTFTSFTYDGFVAGYTNAAKQMPETPAPQSEEFPTVSAAYAKAVADYYDIKTVITDPAAAKQQSDQLMHQFTAELRKDPSCAPFPNNGDEKYWFVLAKEMDDGSITCMYVPDVYYHAGSTFEYADIEFRQVDVYTSRSCIYALYPEPEIVFAHGMLPQIAEEKAKAFILKQYPDYKDDIVEAYCMENKIYVTNYDKETSFYVDYAFTKAEQTRYQGQIEYSPA